MQQALFLGLDRPAGYFFWNTFHVCFDAYIWHQSLGSCIVSDFFGLCTNHFILFEAGHSSKIMTVFTAPLMIAGMVCCTKKSYLGGAALFTLGAGLNLYANHPQMTYYLAMALVFT